MPNPTTNYGWATPVDGASTGVWGAVLNTMFDAIDTDVAAVQATADAALSRTGGTMTGEIVSTTQTWTHSSYGNTGITFTIDLDVAHSWSATVDQATVIEFDNEQTSGEASFVVLELTNGGAFSVSWDANLKWAGGSTPTLTTSGVDILTFYTHDAGANWYGAVAVLNAAV